MSGKSTGVSIGWGWVRLATEFAVRRLQLLVAALLASSTAIGCSEGAKSEPDVGSVSAALTPVAARTYGFESLSDWSLQVGRGPLELSNEHSEGAHSLSLRRGYSLVQSRKLPKDGTTPSVVGFDVKIPQNPANRWWYGAAELFIDVPSAGVWWQYLGNVNLTGLQRGQFNRVEFTVPEGIRRRLDGRNYQDLTVRVALNVPDDERERYLVDRFIFGPATPTCTPTSDDNPCTIDTCDATGPVHTPAPAGQACADADRCNGDETCNGAGACAPGVPPVVPPATACVSYRCDAAAGVVAMNAPSGTACDDATVCNGHEACNGSGACAMGSALPIPASTPCTSYSCDPLAGIVATHAAAGFACDNATVCDGRETCDGAGACTPGQAPVVADANPCTIDACDPVAGVVHTPATAGTACADADKCNGDEACNGAGACTAGVPPVIPAALPCASYSCDPIAGVVTSPSPAGQSCDDATVCNGHETCDGAGSCAAGTPLPIPAGIACKSYSCDPTAGVIEVAAPAGTACDNATVCDGRETCDVQGVCVAGSPPVVTDDNPCTADSCDPVAGVVHAPSPDGTACNDGNGCTARDICAAGACTGADPVVCTARDACHDPGVCDPSSGICSNPARPTGASCNDSDACTSTDACDAAGQCRGTPVVLDTSNPCRVGSCNPQTGISYAALPAGTPCGDSGVCTADGACISDEPTCENPSDGNECTEDTCADGVLVHRPRLGSPCAADGFCDASATCVMAPPEPGEVAPIFPSTMPTSLFDEVSFLFNGADPVQFGADPQAFEARRIAVVRGSVLDAAGAPLEGVVVEVKGQPELGSTLTRADGAFDLAVNGGGDLTLAFQKETYLPAQRKLNVPWESDVYAPTLRLVQRDSRVTEVDFGNSATMQVAQGSVTQDGELTRQATLMFAAGTAAEARLADGQTVTLDAGSVRATEYTVGPHGQEQMPAPLPPNSAYTYAVELSVDQADALGAEHVEFSKPVAVYVDNFLKLPVGTPVLIGYLDRRTGHWVPSPNGIIVRIVGEQGGSAQLDFNGDGVADPSQLESYGVTPEELQRLAGLYEPGASLWRSQVTHFSPWDCNWPYSPPDDADPPPDPTDDDDDGDPDDSEPDAKKERTEKPDCRETGSVISVYNQTVGQHVPVAGTDLQLSYSSVRSTRYDRERHFVATGSSVPASLQRVQVDVELAGRTFHYEVPTQPHQVVTFSWDGTDNYGRMIPRTVEGRVRVTYTYPVLYAPGFSFTDWPRAGAFAGQSLGGDREARTFTVVSEQRVVFPYRRSGTPDEGWNISAQHSYDAAQRTVNYGWGGVRPLPSQALRTLVGTPQLRSALNPPVTSGPLTTLALGEIVDIEARPDGKLLLADQAYDDGPYKRVIWEVDTKADTARIIAGLGCGSCTPSGINRCRGGDSAVNSCFEGLQAMSLAADGTLYVADSWHVEAIGPDGVMRHFAGTAFDDPNGSTRTDVPSVRRRIGAMSDLAVAPSGAVYGVSQGGSCLMVFRTDGFSADATRCDSGRPNASRPPNSFDMAETLTRASQTMLGIPVGVAAHPDGSVFVLENGYFGVGSRIRRLRPDGMLELVAGRVLTTIPTFAVEPLNGAPGLGRDVMHSNGQNPRTSPLAVDPERGLYLFNNEVKYLDRDGIWRYRTSFFTGKPPFGYQASGVVAPDKTLIAGAAYQVYDVDLEGRFWQDKLLGIPSASGDEIYQFDGTIHRATIDGLTGHVKQSFEYDDDGALSAVVDAAGRRTTIERDANGVMQRIIAPSGQVTELAWQPLRERAVLTSITDPAGQTWSMTYDDLGGMVSFANPGAQPSSYEYDEYGKLVAHTKPDGGRNTLELVRGDGSVAVLHTSALGRVERYETTASQTGERTSSHTDANGSTTTVTFTAFGGQEIVEPDGTRVSISVAADPRWGPIVPYVSRRHTRTPANRETTVTTNRQITLANPSDPFSITSYRETFSHPNGTTTWSYLAAERRWEVTSAQGRKRSIGFDDIGRVKSIDDDATTPDFVIERDVEGQLSGFGTGTAKITLGYDQNGWVESTTDATAKGRVMLRDAVGRPTEVATSAGRVVELEHDWQQRLTRVGMPGGESHLLSYNGVGLLTSFTPAGGLAVMTQRYDADFALVTRLLGLSSQTYGYDAFGRLTTIDEGSAVISNTFAPASRLATTTRTPSAGSATTVELVRDGSLVTGLRFSGPVAAQANYTLDSALNHTRVDFTIGSTSLPTTLGFDKERSIVQRGPLLLQRSGPGGAVSRITDTGSRLVQTQTYDASGRPSGVNVTVNGIAVYSYALERDPMGLVTGRTETVAGVGTPYTYGYSEDNELLEVTANGAIRERYVYDDNGNRVLEEKPGVTREAVYDAADRLQSYGGIGSTVNDDGFVTGFADDTFSYGPGAELLSATTAAGAVSFEYDGFRRRTAEIGPAATVRYFYVYPDDDLLVSHTLENGVVTTYFYDDGRRLVALERSGTRYFVATDAQGTPRVVTDSLGAIVRRIERDAFGQVLSDSNPSFALDVGFAGGLSSRATPLVRFGLRDYDPRAGRWMARDPLLFGGSELNLAVYVGNNPIQRRDPSGLFSLGVGGFAGVGGGLHFSAANGKMALCAEFGLGLGGGIDLDPFTTNVETDGWKLITEVGAGFGPCKVGLSATADECGTESEDIRFKPTQNRFDGTLGCGPINFENGDLVLKKGLEGLDDAVDDIHKSSGSFGAVKAEGKISMRNCVRF